MDRLELARRLNKSTPPRKREVTVNPITHERIKKMAKLHDTTMTKFLETIVEIMDEKMKEQDK